MLAIDEVVDHAALDGPGAIEGVERDQVLDAARLVPPQDIAHVGGLELEHAAGVALAEDLEGGGVLQRQIFQVEPDAVVLLDQSERVVDDGQRGESEEVHLQERQLLEAVHVVLRDDFIPAGAIQRHDLPERHRRNDDAGGVDGGVAAHALDAASHLEDLGDLGVVAPGLAHLGLLLHGLVEGDVQDIGDQLGEPVHLAEAHLQHPADVLDRRARAERVEGDDLRHLLAAVLLGDVLDDLAAAVHAEVDVDVGQADPLGVQEALEQQAVLQGIDVGDAHRVTDQAPGG